jgi:2-oxoglutarate dehydrogenase E2 component (dihydrolipoamide succinyltransferase)
MNRMRQAISRRLKEAQNTTASLTTFNEVDMTGAMNLRKESKEQFEKTHGVRLGFMSIFAKACAAALEEVPAINAVIDDEANEIVYRDYVDISIAVASPRGLVVPVVRNVEQMSMLNIESTVAMLGEKARNDQSALEDMAGGTFTISNGGVFGSMMGTPIINLPQSAVLGMHGIKQRAMVVDGEIVARPMMYIALTYDHRLVDGREAVTFLCSVRDKVEDPRRLLLGL